ncbi:MAG: hypothetical protein ABUL60_01060 [Myxococcales bacterium]
MLALSVAGTLDACGDSSDEKLRAVHLAGSCSIDSDCVDDLVCAFGHCHYECGTDKDCAKYKARCVRDESGGGVCQLPSEEDCLRDKDCVGEQVCASDGQCRDLCSSSLVCVEGAVCATGDYCASESEVDAQGNLVSSGTGVGGAGGRGPGSGEGGNGIDAAGAENGGAAITGGGPMGGDSSSIGGSTAGGASEGGAGAGGVISIVDEMEPNETRDAPMHLGLATSVQASFSTDADADFYEVVTPESDAAGGYYEFSVTDIPQGEFSLSILSGVNFGIVGNAINTATVGQSYFGYWASGPGQAFLIKVSAKAGQVYPYKYVLNVRYTPALDPLEPNDTRQTATDLAIGDPVQSLLFSGYVTSTMTDKEYDDWYRVELAAGPFTAALSNVPASANAEVDLYDSGGAFLLTSFVGTLGADVTLSNSIATPGVYYLLVSAYDRPSAIGQASKPGDVPAHFRDNYTFTVTQ